VEWGFSVTQVHFWSPASTRSSLTATTLTCQLPGHEKVRGAVTKHVFPARFINPSGTRVERASTAARPRLKVQSKTVS